MTNTDSGWGGIIEKTVNFGREDRSSNFKKITQLDSQFEKFTQCSHVMIYSRTKSEFMSFPQKAYVLMQMRCDGYVGFPGGFVDNNETPIEAICREIKEELGWTIEKGEISESNYQFSHVDPENSLVLHFYAIEVPENKFQEIELNLPKASDFGTEVLGHFRVPLYTMGDAFRGFPAFLRNHFIGNAKLQLIETICNLKLLTEEQIIQALYSAPRITH